MTPTITIVGLGPAGPEYVTNQTLETLHSGIPVFVRTLRHPSADIVPASAHSFDDIYESADHIEEVYKRITSALCNAAHEFDEIVYAVPGSPFVAEITVAMLLSNTENVMTRTMPAMSFLDLVWNALGIDPLIVQPRIIDGHRFAIDAAGERGPLLVAQCDSPYVLSDMKLAFDDNPPKSAIVLQRLGLEDECIREVSWHDLDRVIEPDHLTSVWLPGLHAPVAQELARVQEVALRLRRDCPWDAEQTHDSLRRYAIEEVYELADAIHAYENGEENAACEEHLIEELGDVFFQVFAHAAIAEEEGRFTIADIARVLSDKLISRHPHVYGNVVAETSDDVRAAWEANKRKEKQRTDPFDGVPRELPALTLASKALGRAADIGVSLESKSTNLGEQQTTGDTLLRLVASAKRDGKDAEDELRHAVFDFMDTVRQACGQDGLASRA